MKNGPSPSSWVPAAAAVILYVAVLGSSPSFFLSPDLMERGDEAVNALQIENAKAGRELVGPYSRFGFHHPGPLSHYYLAAAEPLQFWAPSAYGKHLSAQLMLTLVWLLLLASQLRRLGLSSVESGLSTAVVALNILALGGGGLPLARVWGPFMVIPPVVLAVATLAGAAQGDRSRLVVLAAAGSYAVQTHLGTAVTLLPVGAACAVWSFRRRPWGEGDARTHAAALAVLAVAWAPVIVDTVVARGGNLGDIWSWATGREGGVQPLGMLWKRLGHFWTDLPVVATSSFMKVRHSSLLATILMLASAVATILLFRNDRRMRPVVAAAWGALLMTMVGAAQVPDELYPYLLFHAYGTVGLICALAWVMALRAAGGAKNTKGVAVVGAAAYLLVLFLVIDRPTGAAVADADVVACCEALEGEGPLELHLSHESPDRRLWRRLATLTLLLRRSGRDVVVAEPWRNMFGDRGDGGTERRRSYVLKTRREGTYGDRERVFGDIVLEPVMP